MTIPAGIHFITVTRAQLAAAQALFSHAEQVDWIAWDEFRARVLAAPLDAVITAAAPDVAAPPPL